jgi:hypothetical protein
MSKINEITKAFVDVLEEKCLEAAKEGKDYLLVDVLSDKAIKLLKARNYRIGYKYQSGIEDYSSELVGNYIHW